MRLPAGAASSELEMVDARLEALTAGTRDNTVISIPSAFGGGGVVSVDILGKRGHVRNSTRL